MLLSIRRLLIKQLIAACLEVKRAFLVWRPINLIVSVAAVALPEWVSILHEAGAVNPLRRYLPDGQRRNDLIVEVLHAKGSTAVVIVFLEDQIPVWVRVWLLRACSCLLLYLAIFAFFSNIYLMSLVSSHFLYLCHVWDLVTVVQKWCLLLEHGLLLVNSLDGKTHELPALLLLQDEWVSVFAEVEGHQFVPHLAFSGAVRFLRHFKMHEVVSRHLHHFIKEEEFESEFGMVSEDAVSALHYAFRLSL